jgi:hypothetical protein
LEATAFRAMSGTRVKSEAPYFSPLTYLKRVRCTNDEVSWVWNDTEP